MKTSKIAMSTLAVASIAMAGVVIAPTMLPSAKGQGQQNQAPMQNPGGPGAGPPQQFRRGGGRQGGFGGANMPFATGTVTAVDAAAKTITITSQFGGNSETIQVSDTTKIEAQVTASVTDLKTGDHVQVQGIPTGITASSLTIGENPMAQGRPGGRPGGFGGGPGGNPNRPGGPAQPASAEANGSVTATNPLTISLGEGATLTLKTDSKTKVTKFATVGLDGIKVGDRIFSQGQSGANGVFAATSVDVNMQGGGFGGFGIQFPGGMRRGGQFPGGPPRGGQFPGGPPRGGQFPGGPPQGGQFPGGPPQGGQFPGGPPQGGQFPGGPPQGGEPAPPAAPDDNGF